MRDLTPATLKRKTAQRLALKFEDARHGRARIFCGNGIGNITDADAEPE